MKAFKIISLLGAVTLGIWLPGISHAQGWVFEKCSLTTKTNINGSAGMQPTAITFPPGSNSLKIDTNAPYISPTGMSHVDATVSGTVIFTGNGQPANPPSLTLSGNYSGETYANGLASAGLVTEFGNQSDTVGNFDSFNDPWNAGPSFDPFTGWANPGATFPIPIEAWCWADDEAFASSYGTYTVN